MTFGEIRLVVQRFDDERKLVQPLIVQFLYVRVEEAQSDHPATALPELIHKKFTNKDQPCHHAQSINLLRSLHQRQLPPLALGTGLLLAQLCIAAELSKLVHFACIVPQRNISLRPARANVFLLLVSRPPCRLHPLQHRQLTARHLQTAASSSGVLLGGDFDNGC